MKILWLLFLLHTACAQPGFGQSYLRNSRLCHQWSCINNRLGLPDSLPPVEDFRRVLRSLLPTGSWQDVVDRVVHTCYDDRSRQYTNTCPGQALLQCTVDQLVNYCPEESLRKDDACAPVNSLAGLSHMFSQSRYENLERNILVERRPTWFLRNYFSSKCCNLPQLFNSSVLAECGFSTMMQYYKHDPQFESKPVYRSQNRDSPVIFHYTGTEPSVNDDDESANTLHIVSLSDIKPDIAQIETNMATPDPLACCDISEFIAPESRQSCGFHLEWTDRRLTVKEGDVPTTTTAAPERTVTRRDLVVLPQTCEQETCVFNKLNITKSGSVDVEAYKKLLDSLTDSQPEWSRAKARVLTTCLSKPMDYKADCEINKLLACTFDVLSENCPNSESTPKHDPCKHSKGTDRICQISSSKSRPKHRRSVCTLPELVSKSVLSECGLNALSRVEQVVQTAVKPRPYSFASWKHKCLDLTPSTSCLLTKMGVLNKYGFMDYFQMKDKVRHFSENNEWSHLLQVYLNAFTNTPLYQEHCNSAKKFLNVVDSMLMTCPTSKRNTSPQCTKLFQDINNTPTDVNVTKEHLDKALNHFHHLFFPSATPKTESTTKIVRNPIYNYGLLSSVYVPKVEFINVKPTEKKPLVLLPVYMRYPNNHFDMKPANVGVFRSALSVSNKGSQAYMPSFVSTTPGLATPVLTSPVSTPISTTTGSTATDLTTPLINTPVMITPAVSTPVITTPVVATPVVATPVVSTPVVTTPVVTIPVVTTPVVTTPVVTTPVSTTPNLSIPI